MGMAWTGRILSVVVALVLVLDGAVSLAAPQLVGPEMAHAGFPAWTLTAIGLCALAGGVLYAIPRTALMGAILITGFLGGAICTHLRLGEVGSPPQIVSLVLGLLAWTGLLLRDGRLRALSPVAF